MTEREKIPAADNTPSTPTQASPGAPSKTGVYDNQNQTDDAQGQRLVGMYDRPERTGPSPLLLIVAALVVIALLFVLIQFVF